MSQRPLFDFQLRPLDEVAPFGGAQGEHLHWFGLTDGWYWLNVGDDQLFRYSQALLAHDEHDEHDEHERQRQNKPPLPYVDYQVVRLWEDLLDMLPDILEPVPEQLTNMLGPDGAWDAWEKLAFGAQEEITEDEYWAEYEWLEQATSWRHARRLDVGYLQSGPDIWLWSNEMNVHVEWDNRRKTLDGLPAWEATAGMYSLPCAAFLAEVTAFDARLIAEMGERVAAVQRGWSRPQVALDLAALVAEHADRSQWLARRLAAGSSRIPTMWLGRRPDAATDNGSTDWDAVFAAIAHVRARRPSA